MAGKSSPSNAATAKARRTRQRATRVGQVPQPTGDQREIAWPPNVVTLRMRVLPRHAELLGQWLQAGRCMGLADASVYPPETGEGPKTDYILVWVRENTDPAYLVSPEGTRWVVTDYVRQKIILRAGTFEEALQFIRPVLPRPAAA